MRTVLILAAALSLGACETAQQAACNREASRVTFTRASVTPGEVVGGAVGGAIGGAVAGVVSGTTSGRGKTWAQAYNDCLSR